MSKAILLIAAALAVGTAAFRPAARAPDLHGEWVTYAGAGGDSVTAYIAFPPRPDPAPAVVVIHENVGLSDWVRTVADTLAAQGFVAIAPDLLTRRGGTQHIEDQRRAIGSLVPDSVTVDLDATFAFVRELPAVRRDAIGVIGFCWGGGQTFRYATNNPEIKAAVVCYGPSPDLATVSRIRAPVLGVYAENDARINANLDDAERAMREAGREYRKVIYPGTGHGFLRTMRPEDVARGAWEDVVGFLRGKLNQ